MLYPALAFSARAEITGWIRFNDGTEPSSLKHNVTGLRGSRDASVTTDAGDRR